MCSFRKVGISPRWISFERWCCIKHPYPKGVEGQTKPRSHSPDARLLLLTACCLLLEMVVATNMQCRQELPLAA